MSSYLYSETSVENAMPAWLADFACGTEHWRYTTAPYDIHYDGALFTHQPGLKIGTLELSDNEARSEMKITVPTTNVLLQRLWSDPPESPISLTIRRGHLDQSEDYQTYGSGVYGAGLYGGHAWLRRWYGWYLSYEIRSAETAILHCTPWYSDLGKAGTCRRTGRKCPHILGGDGCHVDLAPFTSTGEILTVDGDTITAAVFSAQADDYYTGGVLTDSAGRTRMIVSHSGATAVLSHTLSSLTVGDGFTVTPGCDRVYASDCKDRYSNTLNFGGQHERPTRNVFTGGLV